jgi:hypothetical protein
MSTKRPTQVYHHIAARVPRLARPRIPLLSYAGWLLVLDARPAGSMSKQALPPLVQLFSLSEAHQPRDEPKPLSFRRLMKKVSSNIGDAV